jgi:hypothetical protein
MPDRPEDDHPFNWRALTPAQRNALAWRLTREAREVRARAIGEALRSAVGRLLGWLTSLFVAARLSASARH